MVDSDMQLVIWIFEAPMVEARVELHHSREEAFLDG
jgi:hypothetical protein